MYRIKAAAKQNNQIHEHIVMRMGYTLVTRLNIRNFKAWKICMATDRLRTSHNYT